MKQCRWKSPVVWLSLAALVLFILKNYGFLAFLGLTENSFNELTNLVITILIGFGILNNPTECNRF